MGSAEAILKWRQCQTKLSADKPRLINYFLKQVPGPSSVNGEKLMSPFLEAPSPRPQPQARIPSVQWANPNGFIPSQLTNGVMTASLSNAKDVSIVVTPMSMKPNTIPMTARPPLLRGPKPTTTTTTTKRPFLV